MDDTDVRQAAIDIFAYIVEFNPSMVREFIMQEVNTQDDVRFEVVTRINIKKLRVNNSYTAQNNENKNAAGSYRSCTIMTLHVAPCAVICSCVTIF